MTSASTPRRLKVCCVIGALTSGGSERQLIGILQQLDRSRFQPFLFTFYQHGPLVDQVPGDVPHFCFEQECGPPRSGWLPGGIRRALARRLADYCLAHQIDVVYDRTYQVSLVTGAACRRSKTPYVNTVVENPNVGFDSTAGPWGRLKYFQVRQTYRDAARVVCVSQGLVPATARFFRLPESIFTCCSNFIDDSRLAAIRAARPPSSEPPSSEPSPKLPHEPSAVLPPRPALLQAEPDSSVRPGLESISDRHFGPQAQPAGPTWLADDRPLRMIAVGRLHWQKGLDVLLRAVAQVQSGQHLPVELQLVGEGPAESSLRSLAAELGLRSRVRFSGWLADPSPAVATSDLYVLPSLTEGMPNSLLEALLIGTPAIASRCDFGPEELTENGRWATLVPPNDPTALARAIRDFIANPTAAQSRAVQARAILEPRFTAAQGCRQLERELDQAARGTRQ